MQPPSAVPQDLSNRERQVLRLIAFGHSNQEIATKLYIGLNTVKTYIRTAYRKIGIESRAQAVAWAYRSEFVPLDKELEELRDTLNTTD